MPGNQYDKTLTGVTKMTGLLAGLLMLGNFLGYADLKDDRVFQDSRKSLNWFIKETKAYSYTGNDIADKDNYKEVQQRLTNKCKGSAVSWKGRVVSLSPTTMPRKLAIIRLEFPIIQEGNVQYIIHFYDKQHTQTIRTPSNIFHPDKSKREQYKKIRPGDQVTLQGIIEKVHFPLRPEGTRKILVYLEDVKLLELE